jgi:phytoene desaturase
MHKANQAFFGDPRVVQLFDRYATYNGSSPFMVPATLNIIPHVEFGLGGYAVEGGIYAIPKALAALAEKLGVHFHYETPVQSIGTQKGKITGIVVGAQRRDYPVVISNADVMVTYRLLGDHSAPLLRRYHRLEPSSSGLVFYWGIKAKTPLDVNNIFFGADYPGEFQSLFKEGRCPDDPTVYVNITSKVSGSDAPAGGENWFVLVNAPRDAGQDWDSEVERIREKVWQRVERALGTGIRDTLVCEEVMTPADIAARTGSPGGSLYGISSNSRAAAFLRHPNRSRRHKGLYFCGGSAHPGGGMPLVILSGKIASDLVQKHEET